VSPPASSERRRKRVDRRGIAVSPGVGIGEAYVVERRTVQVAHVHVERELVEEEVARFRRAVKLSHEQLEAIKSKLPHGEHRQILKAQQMMLRDRDWLNATDALIREQSINAEWAFSQTADEITSAIGAAADEYLRERSFDVNFLSTRVLRNMQGEGMEAPTPPEGAIIIAHELSPADTANLHRQHVGGIVTALGGQTSHSAIMARALEIPAVISVEKALDGVESGDSVIVDAVHGIIIVRPTDADLAHYRAEAARYDEFEKSIHKEHALPAVTPDGHHVYLRANVAIDEELEHVRAHGAEGVGLYRTEYMYMGRDELPTEEEHYRLAKRVLATAAPYPVTFRTFDLGSDKAAAVFDEGTIVEPNPALGLRSLRLALRHRDAFLAQLRGLLRAALHGPLRIMLPLVSGLDELEAGLAVVAEARERLRADGLAHADEVPVGIMIEVPSAALIADVLAKRVDFLSIGTNDLIQYCLAIDRDNDEVHYLYKPLHPAILRLVRGVVEAGASAEIPVSLCGEMASHPRYTWVLAGLGLRELSLQPAAVGVVKNIIRQSTMAEMTALARAACDAESAREAERLVDEAMSARFPEHLQHGGDAASVEDE
jgi:phosphotransferase system enzyme I (PtsI)